MVQFDPERHRLNVAALDYGVEEAKRIKKDWPALEQAIDAKIEEQTKFVAWWKAAVGEPGPKKNISGTRYISFREAEKLTGMPQPRVSDLGKRLGKLDDYRIRLLGVEYRAAMLEVLDSQSIQQSLSNEHYTPAQYIEAARKVLGDIDLDPASCAQANETIGAIKYFDVDSDGLKQKWQGRVWLNPPYGNLVGAFIGKLVVEIESNNVIAVIALVNAHCTDTLWFRPLWDGVLCFTDHRINFTGDDTRSGSTHGSVFVYLGDNRPAFVEHFSPFGAVVASSVTIRNKQAFMDALWDWGFLDQCFDHGIRVSDLDGIVERHGHLLFIEAKPPKKAISNGQYRMFGELAAQGFSVLVIWGETDKPSEIIYWTPHVRNPSDKMKADQAYIFEFVRRWFVWADTIGWKRNLDKKSKWPITLDLQRGAA